MEENEINQKDLRLLKDGGCLEKKIDGEKVLVCGMPIDEIKEMEKNRLNNKL
jgi:hypothetical protein